MEKKPEPQYFFPRESFINSGQILSWQNQISKFSVTVNLPSFLYFVLVHILSNKEKFPKRWYHFPRPVQVCFIFNSPRIFCAALSAWTNFSLQLAPDFSNFNILTFFTTSRAISNPPYKWKATNFQKKIQTLTIFWNRYFASVVLGRGSYTAYPFYAYTDY